MTYQLREPDYLDLANWEHQPRDSKGRWTSTGKAAASKATEVAQKFTTVKPGEKDTTVVRKVSSIDVNDPDSEMGGWAEANRIVLTEGRKIKGDQWGKESPELHRRLVKATKEEKQAFFKANGLDSKYPDLTEDDIFDRLNGPSISKQEREDLKAELDRRVQVLDLTAKAVERARLDALREDKKNFWKKFDSKLSKIKGGEHILKMRDKILNDTATLDKGEVFVKVLKSEAFGYGTSVATAVALSVLLGPLAGPVGLAAHKTFPVVLGSPPVSELLEVGAQYLGLRAVRKVTSKGTKKALKAITRKREADPEFGKKIAKAAARRIHR